MKTALITGASRGIGAEISRVFAEEGANVVCVARTKKEGDHQLEGSLELTCEQIINSGGKAQSFVGDVTNFESFATIVSQTIKNWQKIDILINNKDIQTLTMIE